MLVVTLAAALAAVLPQNAAPTPLDTVDARPAARSTSLVAEPLGEADELRLDGVLDEAVWARSDAATGFLQQEPREGEPATEPTEVYVAYDAENLYIGAMLHDSDPSGVLGRELQRDAGLGADDRFMWILDTFQDGRTGYFFEINPAGLMGDGLIGGGGGINKSWDGIWEARVARGAHGWSAEIRIPFRTLNFDPSRDSWGINFQRTVRRKSEETLWSGHLRNQGLFRPVHAGEVTGLVGMSQGLGLEVTPYAVAKRASAPGYGQPGTETPADVGFDLTYSVTPSLRASLTVNTDFAEAEVDNRRVNLTRFPISYPERRDFFLEGSSVYDFAESSSPTPYFSRRIGLVGGEPVPITWGARLGGQAGDYDLGFLQVRTGDHALPTADAAVDPVVLPAEDFTVARVRRRLFTQSSVGAIYTRRATHASGDVVPATGNTYGMDLDLFSSRFLGDQNLRFEAFLVWHDHYQGDPSTTFGDRSSRGVRLDYPNDVFSAKISFREFGDAYSPAVGFVPRRGFRRTQPDTYYRPRPDWEGVRELEFGSRMEHITDLGGDLETFNIGFTLFGIRMDSGDNASIQVGRDVEVIEDDFQIHPEAAIPAGRHTFDGWQVNLGTASRRAVSGRANVSGGEFWSGTRLRTDLALDLTPAAGVNVDLEWERNDVDLPTGAFEANLYRAGGRWQLSPWIAFQGTAQYDDISHILGLFGRLRWIVRPGSEVFLVLTQNLRDGPLSPDPRGGFGTLERSAAVKVNYTYRF